MAETTSAAEQPILVVPNIKFRNNAAGRSPVGTFKIFSDYIEWVNDATAAVTKFSFFKIVGQRVSPPSKMKVQMQLMLRNDEQITFMFLDPAKSKDELLSQRAAVIDSIQQALLAHRDRVAKMATEAESTKKTEELLAKQKILLKDKELEKLYLHLVAEKIVKPAEFWADHYETAAPLKEVGISGAFMSEVFQHDIDGLKLNLTPDTIDAIFNTYPIVRTKHLELVPIEMTEEDFWTKFFQSHYFHRSRMVKPSPDDPFSECVVDDEAAINTLVETQINRKAYDLKHLSDNVFIGDAEPVCNDTAETKEESNYVKQLTLVRRCNFLSERILQALGANVDGPPTTQNTESAKKDGFSALNRGCDKVEELLDSADLGTEPAPSIMHPLKMKQREKTQCVWPAETAQYYRSRLHAIFERAQHQSQKSDKNGPIFSLRDIKRACNEEASDEEDEPLVMDYENYDAASDNEDMDTGVITLDSDEAEHDIEIVQLPVKNSEDHEDNSRIDRFDSDNESDKCDFSDDDYNAIRFIHLNLGELLKHFWRAIPSKTKELKEKKEKMQRAIIRFREEQFKEAVRKYGAENFTVAFEMLRCAEQRF